MYGRSKARRWRRSLRIDAAAGIADLDDPVHRGPPRSLVLAAATHAPSPCEPNAAPVRNPQRRATTANEQPMAMDASGARYGPTVRMSLSGSTFSLSRRRRVGRQDRVAAVSVAPSCTAFWTIAVSRPVRDGCCGSTRRSGSRRQGGVGHRRDVGDQAQSSAPV